MTTMLRRMCSPISRQACRFSTKSAPAKVEVKMNEEVYEKIETQQIKARKHEGRLCSRLVQLPEWFPKALEKLLEDTSMGNLSQDSKRLANHLHGRQVPTEATVAQLKLEQLKEDLASQRNEEKLAHLSAESVEKIEHAKSLRLLKRAFYGWAPVQYNKYTGMLYLVARGPQEYAVLYRIINEIATRDKEFQPRTLLDFGSGVGTTIWAANQLWPDKIQEHLCVDISVEMNDLSELIIGQSEPQIKGVMYRQYLPISHRKYDLVVSAYSLLELPTMHTRLETVAKLWAKTEQYLVIVEKGTNAGFKVVNEARDFILHMQRSGKSPKSAAGHIFSPCPHELPCPRYGNKAENTPCNFQTSYIPLPNQHKGTAGSDRYSYVVFKKGECTDETRAWPRLVRKTLVRTKHSICRMCTAQGKLEEVIFRASEHGKWMYWTARSSRWGDRLPVETNYETEDKQTEVADEENEE